MERASTKVTEYQMGVLNKMIEMGLYNNINEAIGDAVGRLIRKEKKAFKKRSAVFRDYSPK